MCCYTLCHSWHLPLACLTGGGCFPMVQRKPCPWSPCPMQISRLPGGLCLWKGFFPVFPTCFSFVALYRGLSKTQVLYLGLGDLFFFPVVSFGTWVTVDFAFWWTEMADRLARKPAKRYYSFSGISRKDSVKALRFSRSLNLKRATSEISKRQVGTEISDPFKFPLELKVLQTFEKSFENLIWKFN